MLPIMKGKNKSNIKPIISACFLPPCGGDPGKPRSCLAMDPLTMVRPLQRQARLMVRKNLKLDLVSGICQELGCFCQGAVLHAGAIDGQDVIPHVQCATSTGRRHTQSNQVLSSLDCELHVLQSWISHSFHLLKKKKSLSVIGNTICHILNTLGVKSTSEPCRKQKKKINEMFISCSYLKKYFGAPMLEVEKTTRGARGEWRTGKTPIVFFVCVCLSFSFYAFLRAGNYSESQDVTLRTGQGSILYIMSITWEGEIQLISLMSPLMQAPVSPVTAILQSVILEMHIH